MLKVKKPSTRIKGWEEVLINVDIWIGLPVLLTLTKVVGLRRLLTLLQKENVYTRTTSMCSTNLHDNNPNINFSQSHLFCCSWKTPQWPEAQLHSWPNYLRWEYRDHTLEEVEPKASWNLSFPLLCTILLCVKYTDC